MTLTKYKSWLKLNQDAERTIDLYYKYVLDFFKQHKKFNQDNVNKFLLNILETKSKNTFNLYRSALKNYNDYKKHNIIIPKPKKIQQKYDKPYITENKMLDYCKYIDKIFKRWPKYLTLFKFMFYTGLRLQEIVNLKRQDILFDKDIIGIQKTKTYQARQIPIYPKLKKDIHWYFNLEKEKKNCFNTSRDDINYMFQQMNQQINIQPKLHAHMMRRSCAIWYYEKTKDLIMVQRILGHVDIKTTMIYLDIDTNEMIKSIHKIFKKDG